MLSNDLVGAGFATGQTKGLQGSITTGITAAGNSLATATVLTTEINVVSSGSGAGVALPPWANTGDAFTIYNFSGGNLSVYPPSATAKINGGTLGAAITVSSTKTAVIRLVDNGVNFYASYS